MGETVANSALREMPKPLVWAGLVAFYVLGAWMAQAFTLDTHKIVLIWPATGVALAALLLFGLRAWPIVALGTALSHLLVSPVPWPFMVLSVLSNTLASVFAASFIRRYSADPLSLRLRSGLMNLIGCVLLAISGGILGSLSLYLCAMVAFDELPLAFTRWALGDLYGAIVVAPTLMLGYRSWQLGRLSPQPFRYARTPERIVWILSLIASCWLVLYLSSRSPSFALGMSFLPLTLLIWSAMRLEPFITAFSTTAATLVLATISGLGLGGFRPPQSTVEVSILMLYLSLLALIPLLFAAVNYDARMKTRELLRRAATDRLTGLPNRGAFESALERLLKTAGSGPHALLHADLDQFKVINDTVSHRVGDELICQLASLLRAEVPAISLLARLGGDEFAVLLNATDAAQASKLANQLRLSIERFRFAHDEDVLSVTASIGLVEFSTRDSLAHILQAADTACFTAKEHGGNRIQLGDTERVSEQSNAMHWIVRLNQALDLDQFSLYCQSIAPLNGELVRGDHFEVLLRLNDPATGKILLPGEFIAAAERFKMINRIDRYVFDRCVEFFERHPAARARAKLIAINFSSASLADDGFPEFVENRLRDSSVRPDQLCFEITETGAVKDLAHARGFISRLKAFGIRFALDDFGSGFCSFGYLKSLEVDFFKIDGSFVRGVLDSKLDLTVIKAIAEMAQVLNRKTIAECAETPEIHNALRALNVDMVQGYAIDEPMPIELYFA